MPKHPEWPDGEVGKFLYWETVITTDCTVPKVYQFISFYSKVSFILSVTSDANRTRRCGNIEGE